MRKINKNPYKLFEESRELEEEIMNNLKSPNMDNPEAKREKVEQKK